ncbi:penicillin-binding protein 2 [Oscillatoriales cyanobacterium LEGE 11467]|uniref:Penicillin-binding protein 2 n=1 Tax=Zarconia navalis LEGE 11467 TaxID=1828826 RepID=A0A928W1W9_9CYAN|nr:penicillin-binding protein 2 [Zarconia navalis]MBE9042403.1 penicillin-binding protein 2 [Zarconia navalis LEGE 11467]
MKSDLYLSSARARPLSYTAKPSQISDRAALQGRTFRALFVMGIVSLGLGICSLRIAQLQLVQGKEHRAAAEDNRVRLVPVPAARGNILDRNDKPIAISRLSRSVYLWPRQQSRREWRVTATQLSSLLDLSTDEILEQLEKAGFSANVPVRIRRDLDRDTFIALSERTAEFPGLEIRGDSSRYYPHQNFAAHLLGYIGEATEDDLKENPNYPMGMLVGKMGVERSARVLLDGQWGNRLIEVNAKGEEIQELGTQEAEAGTSLNLTLNLDLQKTAQQALGDRRGAAVVLDAKTGAVLAMASAPTFDPNIFTRRVVAEEWERLQGVNKPFLNRALQGYPPGSTFKIVTSVAGMESGQFFPDSVLGTSSYITVGGTQFHEHSGGYGVIGFLDALAYSSNTFFYQVGMAAGPEEIAKWGKILGIGTTDLELLGLDGSLPGSLPTPEEKEELYGEPWYTGDTVSMSIGQGLVLVTPLELAVMVSTVANGGMRVKPHLLAQQTNTAETEPEPTGIAPGTLDVIRAGLQAVVESGTGRSLNDGSIPLTAGKTGTVEVPGQEDNSVYVAYGPASDPEIAIAVVVEEGGYGSKVAAPIAHELFKTYFGVASESPLESSDLPE